MTQSATPTSPTKTMVLRECGICQSPIFPDDSTTTCPRCNLTFHAECWTENFGCASYGCEQVNALKPREPEPEHTPVDFSQPIPQSIERLPWNFVLLGAAAISIALSSLTFGAPSAIVFAAIVGRIIQTKKNGVRLITQPILMVAAILALVGFIAGTLISRYWHFQ